MDDSTSTPGQSWWSSRRTIAAIAVVAVLVVAALYATFGPSRSRTPVTSPPVQGAASPSSVPVGAASTPAVAGGGDQAVPRTPPQGVTWSSYQTLVLPYSTTAGPRHVDGDVATGYSHTPVGALIAAAQIGWRFRASNNWRAVMDQSVAPGVGRDVWAATRAKYGNWAPPDPGTLCQYAGFAFVAYTPQTAVVDLVSRCPGGQLQSAPTTVEWSGDWRLVLQPDGGVAPNTHAVLSLNGYVPWGGV